MSIASIKAQLAQYGLTPNKALGQNFLADEGGKIICDHKNVAEKIGIR